MNSVCFCTPEMLERLKRIEGLKGFLETRRIETGSQDGSQPSAHEDMTNQHRLTNVGAFRAYIDAYLRSHRSIHTEEMAFLVRQLPPSPEGLPLEIYAFTKTVDWVEYESIQAEIFDHLIAAAQSFDLRIFQQPTGLDFASLTQ